VHVDHRRREVRTPDERLHVCERERLDDERAAGRCCATWASRISSGAPPVARLGPSNRMLVIMHGIFERAMRVYGLPSTRLRVRTYFA
jgi:hypothetical protein